MQKTITIADIVEKISSSSLNDQLVVHELTNDSLQNNEYPFKFYAFMIALCVEGNSRIQVDLKTYDISPNSLLIIQPNTYISFERDENRPVKALCVACSVDIVDNSMTVNSDILSLFIHKRLHPVTQVSETQAKEIRQYYDILKHKISQQPTRYQKPKLFTLLHSALFEIMECVEPDDNNIEKPSRKEEIMGRFIKLVRENFKINRTVNFYADKLCITPKHLSAVVKKISGMTAGDWIDNYVILEAKMMLKSTTKTILEISQELNFPNQSFFGKYFKHITGLSPTQFRSQL